MKNNGQKILSEKNLLTFFPAEKNLLRVREFWIVLIWPILATLVVGFIIACGFGYILTLYFNRPLLVLSSSILILAVASSIIAKILIDWHGHFYILTTHRILEVCYKPLFSTYINNVILNQVKSTEVDIEGNGLINQLFNIGNVMITFDRPTHQEEFRLMNIKNPKAVGFLFAEVLDFKKADVMDNPVWFKTKKPEHPFRFTQEIFPGGAIA